MFESIQSWFDSAVANVSADADRATVSERRAARAAAAAALVTAGARSATVTGIGIGSFSEFNIIVTGKNSIKTIGVTSRNGRYWLSELASEPCW